MTDFVIRRERESVCNNNCKPIHSVVETQTNATSLTRQNNNKTPLKLKSKTMIFTIVGIRNYLPNGEADYPTLFSRLPIGAIVYLRKEPTGSSFPGSISVWDDECNQIGSISKIERRFIELDVPQNGMLPVKVSGHSAEHNCMYFEAENKNGFKDPYIRDVKLEEGETAFPMAKQDKELQTLTALMKTLLNGLKNEDTVSDHFIITAYKYAQICCSSLDGDTSFSRGDIMFAIQQLKEKFQQLIPIYDEIFEKNKDIGRKYNDIKTEVYRNQYERIKQMALGKDKNGISPLDSYIKNLKFKNGDQLPPEIISNEIVHLSNLLSKEFYGSYYYNIDCDENFATALYSLNYSMTAIYRMFTRRIKLDYLKEIKNSLNAVSKTMPADTGYDTTKHSQRTQKGESVKESDTQSETGLSLPDSLDTQRAHTYFQKAIDNGLLKLENGKFSWIQIGNKGGKSQLAYFCGKVFEYEHSINGNVGTSFPEEDLNELFGIKRMQSLLQQVYEATKKQPWRRRIDELFE